MSAKAFHTFATLTIPFISYHRKEYKKFTLPDAIAFTRPPLHFFA